MSVKFRFLATALVVFVLLALLLTTGFVTLRLNQFESDQREQAAAFASDVASLVHQNEDDTAQTVARAYLDTLTGRPLYVCFSIIFESGAHVTWPVQSCEAAATAEGYENMSLMVERDDGRAWIEGYLDPGGPARRMRDEVMLVVLTILGAGIIGFGATSFSYARSIGRPLSVLRSEIVEGATSSRTGLSVFEDISNAYTELLRRESEVRRQEAFRRSVTESAFDCIVSADGDGRITEFNEAAERTFGFNRSDILGRTLAETIIPEKYRDMHEAGMRRYIETGTGNVVGNRVELEALHADGSIFPVELSLIAVQVDDEYIFTAYFRDITERLAREAELEQLAEKERLAQARLVDAVNALSDGFVFYDSDDKLVICNERYREIYSESADLLVPGASFADIIRIGAERGQYLDAIGNEEAWIADRMNRHFNPGEPMEQQLPNGRWVRVEERRTNDGGIVGFRVDITDLKQRTFEMEAAKEEAEEANQAKTNFLATISHEIRSPLNAVLGALSLLNGTTLNDEQTRYVETSRKSGEALLTVINDVLDMAKIESGHVDLEYSDFDLHALARESVELFMLRAESKGLQFDLVIDQNVARFVHGDPTRIRQVLINLIGNAVKYTDEGGVTVWVSDEDTDDGVMRFNVVDTGIGIPEEKRADLFEPFTQVDDRLARQHEGTGLGLAISKTLVELMGGKIGVDSRGALGSEFWFEIPMPAAEGAPALATSTDRPGQAPRLRTRDDRRVRVLLAEDSPSNQMVFRTYLEKAGIDVDVVGNGAEAVEAIDRFPYDLVLMDISMPEMDGLEASQTIIEKHPDTELPPIIALTANAAPGFRTTCLKAGMKDYLLKPVTMPRLLEVVRTWLDLELVASEPSNSQGAAAADTSDWIDDDMITQLRQTAGEGFPRLIATFLQEATQRTERLGPAFAAGDHELVGREAHAIKGIAATYGAPLLSQAAADLETAAKGPTPRDDVDAAMIDEITSRLDSTKAAYDALTG